MLVRIVGARQAFKLISSGKVKIVTYFKSPLSRKGVVSPQSNYSTLRVLTAADQECVNFVLVHDCFNENPFIITNVGFGATA
jgi:hypothetical protein